MKEAAESARLFKAINAIINEPRRIKAEDEEWTYRLIRTPNLDELRDAFAALERAAPPQAEKYRFECVLCDCVFFGPDSGGYARCVNHPDMALIGPSNYRELYKLAHETFKGMERDIELLQKKPKAEAQDRDAVLEEAAGAVELLAEVLQRPEDHGYRLLYGAADNIRALKRCAEPSKTEAQTQTDGMEHPFGYIADEAAPQGERTVACDMAKGKDWTAIVEQPTPPADKERRFHVHTADCPHRTERSGIECVAWIVWECGFEAERRSGERRQQPEGTYHARDDYSEDHWYTLQLKMRGSGNDRRQSK